MKPIEFKEQNITYTAPRGKESEVDKLPAYAKNGRNSSLWKLSLWERIKIMFTGKIWFSVMGNQSPILLTLNKPFKVEGK